MTGIQELKTCTSCNLLLPITKFKLRAKTGRQAGTRQAQCNRCIYVRYTRPSTEKKITALRQYKLDKGCSDCGYRAHPEALQFDHADGAEKLFNIGETAHISLPRLWAEVEKCEIVCANCHAIRTATRRERVSINAWTTSEYPKLRG